MADHYKVTDHDGTTIIHCDGPIQPGDVALCGQDLCGDSHLGWEMAEETNKKINCKHCIRIIKMCKEVKSTEMFRKK